MMALCPRVRITIAAALCATGLLAASVAGSSPSSQVPIGPRAIAMGGAFTSIADDATSLFWNPAGLARIGHQEIAAAHADLFDSGIRDNVLSFVLPLSPNQAVGADWYHSGFDDNELGFSENRVDVAWALKVRPWLWAGVGGKLITQNTDLDATSLRSSRGVGMDLGALAVPLEHVRLGFVAQDFLNTRIKSTDGTSDVAYPRNVRAGVSYTWTRWGTAAFDIDDRWHLGLEATPHEVMSLRLGAEKDRHGIEPTTWTYGLGLKAGLFRVDWARADHPTLAPTDHFAMAMEFNFNPAQVRVERIAAHDMFTSLYKSYSSEPLGVVQVRNLQDRPLATKVGVYVPELMSAPSEQDLILRPKAVHEVPLTAVLDERVLGQRGDLPVQIQVSVSYQSRRLVRREKASTRAVAYAPGAIDWSQGMAQAAAFATTRDPAVDAVARQAAHIVASRDRDAFGNRNLSFTAAMVEALATLGVAYVPDPNNPYASIADTQRAVDTINYPYQTLERLSGDCDDTTVLLASLLGNVGIRTQFVDAPGHIFLLVDTGLHERNRMALGVDSTLVVIDDEEVWIPIETTALAKGFAEAWRLGAEEVASWSMRGQIAYVDVEQAQARYEPAYPPGDRKPVALDTARVAERLAAAAGSVDAWRRDFYTARYGGLPKDLEASVQALDEIAHVLFDGGDLDGARVQLEQALARAPQSIAAHNNFAIVLAAADSLDEAEEHWRTALVLGAKHPGVWLNLGLGRWALGDTLSASQFIAYGVIAAGGYEQACGLIGLTPQDSLNRAGVDQSSRADTRAALLHALRNALRVSGSAAPQISSLRMPGSKPGGTPGTSYRTSNPHAFRHYHWIEQ